MGRDALKASFQTHGFAVIRNAVSTELANVFANYAILQARRDDYYSIDERDRILSPASRSRYADAFGETLLLRVQPRLEAVVGEPLHPTYSYLRIYGNGSILDGHVDRPESEIAASMALGCIAEEPWLLYLQARDGVRGIALAPGDLVVYEGMQLPHWRKMFDGEACIQVVFSYVRAHGRFAALRYDRREDIGPFSMPGLRD